jgi:nucleotide-binding universal stress UspA family protein
VWKAERVEEDAMAGYLIVANQTLGGVELDRAITERLAAGRRDCYVLVPMTPPQYEVIGWAVADAGFAVPPTASEDLAASVEVARQRSEHRLERMLARVRAAGGEPQGEVGDSDPVEAVKRLLERRTFDEILVSTLPVGISRWLKLDLPSRIARCTDIPVVTVEATDRRSE